MTLPQHFHRIAPAFLPNLIRMNCDLALVKTVRAENDFYLGQYACLLYDNKKILAVKLDFLY